jgi:anti-anti-sigma factor
MRTPVDQIRDLAASVVQHVARTREAVVLADATRDPRFAADPYIAIQKPKSILCLALAHQGRLAGVLYLENNLARDAFSAGRIELLELLSSQAASAVENALLYSGLQEAGHKLRQANERLEQQVAGRTEELREANEALQRRTEELRLANERLTHELGERERAEAARAALQEEVIRIQRMQLMEVSAPLIPITDEIMVMPLIGTVDELRSQQVLDTLLQGAQRGARVLVLDVTGLRHVDSHAASALVRAANAVRLLGAQAMLTGIRSEVAQTLVELGVDMGDLVIRSTLQSGVAYALGLAGGSSGRARVLGRKVRN